MLCDEYKGELLYSFCIMINITAKLHFEDTDLQVYHNPVQSEIVFERRNHIDDQSGYIHCSYKWHYDIQFCNGN